MLSLEKWQRFSVQATLGTGDSTKTLQAGGAGITIYITSLTLTSLVAAAQVLYVGDTSGTVKGLSLPASYAAANQAFLSLLQGLPLTIAEDLIIKPAAAGPSVHVVAEGYIIRV